MRNYKNYEVWKESHDLVLFIYKQIVPNFPKEEKYELTSQMKRAASSIPLNIAEGCGRNSDKNFIYFVDISLGSANELEYCVLLTHDLGFIHSEQFALLDKKINIVRAMLINLIKSIRSNEIYT